MTQVCPHCKEKKGVIRDATVEYEGVMYCTVCEREWISARRHGAKAMADLPDLLRAGIKGKGWKFREIADFIGVTEVAFGRYVSRDPQTTSRPGLENFVAICHATGLLPNDLLGFVDPKKAELEKENERLRKAYLEMFEIFNKLGYHLGDKPALNLAHDRRVDREDANPYTEQRPY